MAWKQRTPWQRREDSMERWSTSSPYSRHSKGRPGGHEWPSSRSVRRRSPLQPSPKAWKRRTPRHRREDSTERWRTSAAYSRHSKGRPGGYERPSSRSQTTARRPSSRPSSPRASKQRTPRNRMEDRDDAGEGVADRARLLDLDSEQPDPIAARAAIDPYVEDIDSYMRSLEELRRPRHYMPETSIMPSWRAILVEWLVEVTDDFHLVADTLHLAVSYVDRFLSVGAIAKKELQLLGAAALLLAAKYESDRFRHSVETYCYITDNTYTEQQMLKMEANILNLLKFEMGSPTARTFLRRYMTVCRPTDRAKAKKLEFLCSYLAELSLLDYECTRFKPSVVAAACLFVARFTIHPHHRPWNLMLQRYMDYKVSDLKCCILRIHSLQSIGTYPGIGEKAIREKYRHCQLERVSEMASPQEIPEYFLKDIKY